MFRLLSPFTCIWIIFIFLKNWQAKILHLLHGWTGEVSLIFQFCIQLFNSVVDKLEHVTSIWDSILLHFSMFFFFCFSSRRTNKVEDGFSSKRCLTWFKQYTTADEPDVLGPDAMEQFCNHIGVEPENVVMLGKVHDFWASLNFVHPHNIVRCLINWFNSFSLDHSVIAYKMNARQMGFFTQAEWQKGLTDLQCDSALKLQSKLDYLRNLMNDPNVFKNIYRYAYDFARVSVENTWHDVIRQTIE